MKAIDVLKTIFDNPYFQNVASEFITIFILVFMGWVIYHFTKRSRLLTFFNIKKSKRLVIYLSNLLIEEGGSRGFDGQPRRFNESAIPLYEVELIPRLQRLFNFIIPGMEGQRGLISKLSFSDVSIEILASPMSRDEVDKTTTFITVGSPGLNVASNEVQDSYAAQGKFDDENKYIGLVGTPLLKDPHCAFVQRVYDRSAKQSAFYLAGPSSVATTGAAYYLINQWHFLAKKYPDNAPFCVMLKIVSTDCRRYEVLYEKAGSV